MANLSTLLSTSYIGAQGTAGSALLAWTRIIGTHTATNNSRLIADTTAGSFTVTLPSAPAAGTYVQISDGGNWAINNLTINFAGATIEGINDTLALDIGRTTVEFIYDGTTWQFTSTTGARGPTGVVADDSAMIYSIALGF